jgi:hypothetical protein
MTDSTKIAIDALQSKARELIEDRDETRRRLLEEAARNVQFERDIAGCVAGARALGKEIDVSSPVAVPAQKQVYVQQFQQWCVNIANLYQHLKSDFGVEDEGAEGSDLVDDSRPEMPRIADIILERLKAAGEEGAKAADIRRYIRRTHKADIHEKTVGMTLNRMQAAGQVRRDGRTWFIVELA